MLLDCTTNWRNLVAPKYRYIHNRSLRPIATSLPHLIVLANPRRLEIEKLQKALTSKSKSPLSPGSWLIICLLTIVARNLFWFVHAQPSHRSASQFWQSHFHSSSVSSSSLLPGHSFRWFFAQRSHKHASTHHSCCGRQAFDCPNCALQSTPNSLESFCEVHISAAITPFLLAAFAFKGNILCGCPFLTCVANDRVIIADENESGIQRLWPSQRAAKKYCNGENG